MGKLTFVTKPNQVITRTREILEHSIVIRGKQPLGCDERKDRFGGLLRLQSDSDRDAKDSDTLVAGDNMLDQPIQRSFPFKLLKRPILQGHVRASDHRRSPHSPIPKILSVPSPELLDAPGEFDLKWE